MADTDNDQAPRRRQWLLVAVVASSCVIALSAWYIMGVRQDYAVLYSGLRPAQAAAIVTALEDQGVRYRLSPGGREILAPSRDVDRLRIELEASHTTSGGVDGFELFNESDMGLTDFAQKIRYQRALQGEIARTIMAMQDVAEARVHVSMPERSLFRTERREPEAAVTLAMRTNAEVSPRAIEGIQRLVAAAVADLNPSDVVVLDSRGEMLSSRASIGSLTNEDDMSPSADFLIEAVRLAIPERRFDVALENIPSGLAGGDDPATLGPRRLLTVTTESLLAPEERSRVRERLEQAGLIDASSRNVLTFRVEPMAIAPAPTATPRISPPSITSIEQPARVMPWALISSALLLAAVCGGVLLTVRFFRRPRLSFEQHRLLAERLSAEATALRDYNG